MLEKTFGVLGIGAALLIVVGLFVIGPWFTILAINQLFGTAIEFTFWNWLSVAWLHIVAASTSKS